MKIEDIAERLNALKLKSLAGFRIKADNGVFLSICNLALPKQGDYRSAHDRRENELYAEKLRENFIQELKDHGLLKPQGEKQINPPAVYSVDDYFSLHMLGSVIDTDKLAEKVRQPVQEEGLDQPDLLLEMRAAIRSLKQEIIGKDPALKLLAATLFLGAKDPKTAQTEISNLARTIGNNPELRQRFEAMQGNLTELDL